MAGYEVKLSKALGELNLARALEDGLNDGWDLKQVVFCGMGTADPDIIGARPQIHPVFIVVFYRSSITIQ